MSKVTERVLALAEPVARSAAARSGMWNTSARPGSWYLRVYIDKPGGVSIDDCEAVSRALDPILDEAAPDPHELYIRGVLGRGGAGAQAPERF